MNKIGWLVLILPIFVGACVSGPSEMSAVDKVSPVAIADHFYRLSEAGLVSPNRLFSPITDGHTYRKFENWWCIRDEFTPDQLIRKLATLCSTRGGRIVGDWCEIGDGSPLFKFSVGTAAVVRPGGARCSNVKDIGAIVIEKSKSASAAQWTAFAAQSGFLPKAQVDTINELTRVAIEKRHTEDLRRKTVENGYIVSHVGTKICQDSGRGYVYVGFVEDSANDKIKITISDAVYPRSPGMRPGGFQPTIIWDHPSNWYICE